MHHYSLLATFLHSLVNCVSAPHTSLNHCFRLLYPCSFRNIPFVNFCCLAQSLFSVTQSSFISQVIVLSGVDSGLESSVRKSTLSRGVRFETVRASLCLPVILLALSRALRFCLCISGRLDLSLPSGITLTFSGFSESFPAHNPPRHPEQAV